MLVICLQLIKSQGFLLVEVHGSRNLYKQVDIVSTSRLFKRTTAEIRGFANSPAAEHTWRKDLMPESEVTII